MQAFLIFSAGQQTIAQHFGSSDSPQRDIRRVTDREGLRDYQVIREENRGMSCEDESDRHAFLLENHPDKMNVYVACIDGEPAACGRIYFHESSRFAGLCGGNTRKKFRKRGLFTQIIAVRIREALSRGHTLVSVDASPTSEPILRERGFETVTYTQPYCLALTER